MDARLLRSLRWALVVSGVLGLLCAASMLLANQAGYGHSSAAASVVDRLPLWAVWGATPPSEVTMLVAGALCALLLVAGRWPIKACAALAAAWFAYAQAAFGPNSDVMQRAVQTFDLTPLYAAGLVSVAALLAVAVLAIVNAVLPTRTAEAPLVAAAEPRS